MQNLATLLSHFHNAFVIFEKFAKGIRDFRVDNWKRQKAKLSKSDAQIKSTEREGELKSVVAKSSLSTIGSEIIY